MKDLTNVLILAIDEGSAGMTVLAAREGVARRIKKFSGNSAVKRFIRWTHLDISTAEAADLIILLEAGFLANWGRMFNAGNFLYFIQTVCSSGWRILTVPTTMAKRWGEVSKLWSGESAEWNDKLAAQSLLWGYVNANTHWREVTPDNIPSTEHKAWRREKEQAIIEVCRGDKELWPKYCEAVNELLLAQLNLGGRDKNGRPELDRLREALGSTVGSTNSAVAAIGTAVGMTDSYEEFYRLLQPWGCGYRGAYRGWALHWAKKQGSGRDFQWAARCIGHKLDSTAHRTVIRSLVEDIRSPNRGII